MQGFFHIGCYDAIRYYAGDVNQRSDDSCAFQAYWMNILTTCARCNKTLGIVTQGFSGQLQCCRARTSIDPIVMLKLHSRFPSCLCKTSFLGFDV